MTARLPSPGPGHLISNVSSKSMDNNNNSNSDNNNQLENINKHSETSSVLSVPTEYFDQYNNNNNLSAHVIQMKGSKCKH